MRCWKSRYSHLDESRKRVIHHASYFSVEKISNLSRKGGLKMKKRLKLKVMLFILIIALIVKFLLNISGFKTWYLFTEIELSSMQTSLLYYGILGLGAAFYLIFYHGRYKWSHIFMTATLPLSFFIAFCVYFMPTVYLATVVVYIAILAMDLCDILVSGSIYRRFMECRKRCVNLMIKDFLHSSVYLMGLSLVLIRIILGEWLFVSIDSADYASMYHEDRQTVYATNIRDLESTTGDDLWESNKDKLVQLKMDRIVNQTIEERTNSLQEVLNIECEYLGVEPILLIVEYIPREGVAGYFDPDNLQITLARELVESDISIKPAIHTLLHEAYHYYSYSCTKELNKMKKADINMNLLFARDIEKWSGEFKSYTSASINSSEEELYQYASQAVEIAADEYADKWTSPYMNFINNIEDSDL